MASGKTTIGRSVAKRIGYEFVDLDHFIERRYFKSVSDIFKNEGEEKFRQIEKKCLEEISAFENVLIATGGGTPCYYDNINNMNRTGETFYLSFTHKELVERLELTNKRKRPLISNLSSEELTEFVKVKLSEREPFYQQAKHIIKGNDKDLARQIYEIAQKENR